MKTLWKSVSRVYLQMSLQGKLFVSFFVLATIPAILVGSFFATRLYDMVLADTIRDEQMALSTAAPAIETAVDGVMTATAELVEDATFRHALILSDNVTGLRQWRDKVAAVENLSQVSQVVVYLNDTGENALVEQYPDIFYSFEDISGTYWKGIFAGDNSLRTLLCPTFYLNHQEVSQYGDLAYVVKTQIYKEDSVMEAFVVTYFSSEAINELLNQCLSSDTAVAYIINSRNSMITTTDAALSGTYFLNYETVEREFMSSNNFVAKQVLDQQVYAGFYSITNTDWFLVVTLPAEPIAEASVQVVVSFVAIYLACIALALGIATLLSRNITGRLSRISNQMALARHALPVALPPSDCNDELDDLIDTYNYMTRVICDLMEEQAKVAEEVRRAEFDSLQAQINPHFLYNTMDMIAWMSMGGKNDEVVEAVHDMSRFYRLTLSRKRSMNTVEDELEHVEIYTRLQNKRFENRIDFLADVPDELLDTLIPKLTFQPIVENAILHGLLEHDRKGGSIVITAYQEGEDLVLQISDNGVGIPPEKLPHLLTADAPSTGTGSGVAVYNTHRRLEILYGKGYGLSFDSMVNVGTTVEIRLKIT